MTPTRPSSAPLEPLVPATPRAPALSPQMVALFAIFLLAEALLIVALLRRVEGPTTLATPADFSRQEYLDLDPVSVAVHSSKPGVEVTFTVRVEASILVSGDGAQRAKARDQVRDQHQKVADEIARVVGQQTAEQAVDPGNRERLKDRLRAALNQSVFHDEVAREVVFRYYGP